MLSPLCPQCHAEQSDHPLRRTMEVTMICKKCKKAFRKDMNDYEEGSDDSVLTAKTGGSRRRPPQRTADDDEQDVPEDDDRLDNRLASHLDDRIFSRRTLVTAARREQDEAISERIDEGGWAGALRQAREEERSGARPKLFLGSARDQEDEDALSGRRQGASASAVPAGGVSRPGLTQFDDEDLDWS
ncbi:hypothetical protein OC845_004929 [Tilletia horrida]|nr:hypothetical protein OC845_004929 [Tilletia horrida]